MLFNKNHYPSSAICPVNKLEWYANGTLPPAERVALETHLRDCAGCRSKVSELAELQRVMSEAYHHTPEPRSDLFAQIEQRLDLLPPSSPGLWGWFNLFGQRSRAVLKIGEEHFWIQAHLVKREIFWIPLLILPLLGVLVYFPNSLIQTPSTVALFATLLSAFSMVLLYNKKLDPARELTLVTPTSPRLIIGVRCGLVFGYSLLLNFGLILPFLTFQGLVTPGWFISNWLAPLCCLSAIALFLSVALNANAAILVCSILWGLRSLEGVKMALFGNTPLSTNNGWTQLYDNFWRQGPLLFAIAVGLIFLTFIVVERKENVV